MGDPSGRRLYGRRKGKRLRPLQQALLRDDLPHVAIPPPKPGIVIDPASLFEPRPSAVWLEIGFGGGEHLIAQAKSHPEIGFIGCEPFINGVVSLLAARRREGVRNLRIHADDARPLLEALAPASLGRVFILFPDPWPKKRHHKRRFIQAVTLDLLGTRLRDGAELRLATDDADLALWMREQIGAHDAFEGPAGGPLGFAERPADWPPTRYERKALLRGARPAYLLYRRRPRQAGEGRTERP
ncbi:MAG TPA: tRNA (guanosine(46)-N7)-methyltransferase TrmB [Alphaproteobacteria bacterium]|nr:tRNA (guanosine(46)-N7)-methyltransferase TrmB [Alphaproteobacteria bacterium]